jgi:hypothetical protein
MSPPVAKKGEEITGRPWATEAKHPVEDEGLLRLEAAGIEPAASSAGLLWLVS